MVVQRFLVVGLCVALAGCAAGNSSRSSVASGGTMASSGATVQFIDHSSAAAKVLDIYRPEISDYLKEIESDGDDANWQVPPYTAYQQQ